jgi:hypothetical protein
VRFTDNPFRVARHPDEGREADPNAVAILRGKVDALEGEQRAQVIVWAKEADAAMCSFRPSQNPSLRRFELSRAAWRAVTSSLLPDDTMRAALVAVLGDDQVQPAWPTGALMGSCAADEAQRLAHQLDQWAYPTSEDTTQTGDTAA